MSQLYLIDIKVKVMTAAILYSDFLERFEKEHSGDLVHGLTSLTHYVKAQERSKEVH